MRKIISLQGIPVFTSHCFRWLLFLLFLFDFGYVSGQSKPPIDYIIVNDYMSERNLEPIGPIPAGYNKGIIDSLRNSYVEYYNNGNLVEKRYYSRVGTLYFSEQYLYDDKSREIKKLRIDEYHDDTCITVYQYTDSSNIMTRKKIMKLCDSSFWDFHYKYSDKNEKTGFTIYENGKLYEKTITGYPKEQEKNIQTYDSENRLSTYIYRYNSKGDMIYEKAKEWMSIRKGDYFEVENEYEYIYQYDKFGNWVERTKRTHCPPKPIPVPISNPKSKEPVKLLVNDRDCFVEIKEQLIRKIYYK